MIFSCAEFRGNTPPSFCVSEINSPRKGQGIFPLEASFDDKGRTKEGRRREEKKGRVTSERDETGRALGRWEERLRVLRLYRYWSGRSRNRLLVRILVRFLSPARNSTKETCVEEGHNLPIDSNNLLWPSEKYDDWFFVSLFLCVIYYNL